MKKTLILILLTSFYWAISAQEQRGGDLEGVVSQKYAVVIGNANYTSWKVLDNPINDAVDMKNALESLGFSVEFITDGSLERMRTAVSNLQRRLSTNNNSYGVFYFAGHGVETNGINYLIPSFANIQNRSFLSENALSLQFVLNELTKAKNVLNVVILDSCRNLPQHLMVNSVNHSDRSLSTNDSTISSTSTVTLSRGLAAVEHQPPGSIVVYATGAGNTAEDNPNSRNGLFTGQLLQHIRTPGIEVSELFRRTSASVQQISNNIQVPAIYSMFHGIAYLGSRPNNDIEPLPPPPYPDLTAQQKFERDIEEIRAAVQGNYTVTFIGDIVFTSTFNFSGMQGKIITIQGDNVMRTITNMQINNHYLFAIPNECTLILGNNITLNGNNKSNISISGGRLEMLRGSVVTNSSGQGVRIDRGSFTMENGNINNNNYSGVYICNGAFIMNNGIISNNRNRDGGGVEISDRGIFTMNGGSIINNSAVQVNTYGGFGGGVHVGTNGTFYMRGGTINGNRAGNSGGGVWVSHRGVFIKTGGTVSNTNNSKFWGNVWASEGLSNNRNRTAGLSDNITLQP